MKRVVVADDHTLLRQSLIKVIESQDDFTVVGEAGRGDDALRVILAQKPDLAVLDIEMPGGNGLDVAERVRAAHPEIKIIMLTMHEDDASLLRACALSVDGYMLKVSSLDDLGAALRAVADGQSYLGPIIGKRIMSLQTRRASNTALTARELEVLTLLAEGTRPMDLSDKLFLSPKTVKNHLSNIYAKLHVERSGQAIAEAYRRGLVATPREVSTL